MKKKCPRCCEEKLKEDFNNNRSTTDGLSTYCTACINKKNKTPEEKEKRRLYQKKYRKDKQLRELIARARRKTERKNLPVDELDELVSHLQEVWINGRCQACGKKCLPPQGRNNKHGYTQQKYLTIDHKNPNIALDKNNIGILCGRCNTIKSDMVKQDLENLYNYLKSD